MTTQTTPADQYLRPLVEHWKIVAAVAFLVLLAGLTIGLTATPAYRSTTSIYLNPITADPSQLVDSGEPRVDMATELRLVSSDVVARGAVSALGGSGFTVEPKNLRENVVASSTKDDSRIIDIDFAADSPEKAQAITNSVALAYLGYRAELAANNKSAAETILNARMDSLSTELTDVTTRLSRAAEDSPAALELQRQRDSLSSQELALSEALVGLATLTNDPGVVITPAELPTSAEGLPLPIIIFGSLVAGLGLGAVAAFVLGTLRSTAPAAQAEGRSGAAAPSNPRPLKAERSLSPVGVGAAGTTRSDPLVPAHDDHDDHDDHDLHDDHRVEGHGDEPTGGFDLDDEEPVFAPLTTAAAAIDRKKATHITQREPGIGSDPEADGGRRRSRLLRRSSEEVDEQVESGRRIRDLASRLNRKGEADGDDPADEGSAGDADDEADLDAPGLGIGIGGTAGAETDADETGDSIPFALTGLPDEGLADIVEVEYSHDEPHAEPRDALSAILGRRDRIESAPEPESEFEPGSEFALNSDLYHGSGGSDAEALIDDEDRDGHLDDGIVPIAPWERLDAVDAEVEDFDQDVVETDRLDDGDPAEAPLGDEAIDGRVVADRDPGAEEPSERPADAAPWESFSLAPPSRVDDTLGQPSRFASESSQHVSSLQALLMGTPAPLEREAESALESTPEQQLDDTPISESDEAETDVAELDVARSDDLDDLDDLAKECEVEPVAVASTADAEDSVDMTVEEEFEFEPVSAESRSNASFGRSADQLVAVGTPSSVETTNTFGGATDLTTSPASPVAEVPFDDILRQIAETSDPLSPSAGAVPPSPPPEFETQAGDAHHRHRSPTADLPAFELTDPNLARRAAIAAMAPQPGYRAVVDAINHVGAGRSLIAACVGATDRETSLAVGFGLAEELEAGGARVLIVDAMLAEPRIDSLIGLPLEPGVADLVAGRSPLADVVRPLDGLERLAVVTAGQRDEATAGELGNVSFSNALQEAVESFNAVILLAGDLNDAAHLHPMLWLADGIVVGTTQPVGADLDGTVVEHTAQLPVPVFGIVSVASAFDARPDEHDEHDERTDHGSDWAVDGDRAVW